MKWKVLVSAPYLQPVIDRFRPELEGRGVELILPPVRERLEEDELLAWMGDIDGVICGDDRFTRKVIAAAPKLKVLSKWGTGVDSLDAEACRDHGVAIRRTRNAFSVPVADSVVGYMLSVARNLHVMDRHMHQGVWEKVPGRALEEYTLGVIGVGDVGKEVVRRARSFKMDVLGNDLVQMPTEFLQETGIRMVAKTALLEAADFVSLHTDLNPSSYHLMSDREFALMRPHAIVINTSRGPVIDEGSLIRALHSRKIAGAALDVFEQEPLPADSPLLSLPNVLLAPHNANSSPKYWERVHRRTIDNLLEVLEQREK